MTVLSLWGIRSTSDLGRDRLQPDRLRRPGEDASDSRADFDNVFDFEAALRRDYVVALDDVA